MNTTNEVGGGITYGTQGALPLVLPHLKNVRAIFFNGPPRSGKDTAAEATAKYLDDVFDGAVFHLKFSALLKRKVHEFLGLPSNALFEETKGTRLPEFYGSTPREAYISISEDFAKPRFGEDIWCRLFWAEAERLIRAATLTTTGPIFLVISDLGFQVEIEYFLKRLATSQIAIGRLIRQGTSFDGDSRRYVFSNRGGLVWEKSLYNNKSVAEFGEVVRGFVRDFLVTDPDNAEFFKDKVETYERAAQGK